MVAFTLFEVSEIVAVIIILEKLQVDDHKKSLARSELQGPIL